MKTSAFLLTVTLSFGALTGGAYLAGESLSDLATHTVNTIVQKEVFDSSLMNHYASISERFGSTVGQLSVQDQARAIQAIKQGDEFVISAEYKNEIIWLENVDLLERSIVEHIYTTQALEDIAVMHVDGFGTGELVFRGFSGDKSVEVSSYKF